VPGLVCEDHPTRAWGHDDCGAAGMRCACNPEGLVDWRSVFAAQDEADERLQQRLQ
jgi:hypothetical protein